MHYCWKRNTVPNLFQNISSIGIKQLFTSVCLGKLKTSVLLFIGSFNFCLYVAVCRFCHLCCSCVSEMTYLPLGEKKLNLFLYVFYDPGRLLMVKLNFWCLYGPG